MTGGSGPIFASSNSGRDTLAQAKVSSREKGDTLYFAPESGYLKKIGRGGLLLELSPLSQPRFDFLSIFLASGTDLPITNMENQ